MGVPSRPVFQKQGPASRCIIYGRHFGWLNCTPTSFAMGMYKSTLGRVRMTGCGVREATGDRSGGTTLAQCAYVAKLNGIPVAVHVGSGVVSPKYIAIQLKAGRGVVLQGNTQALLNTTWRSTGGRVNHAIWVNEVRGGTLGAPKEALVYDPAADNRRTSWGLADKGPSWWPWSLVLKFAAALRPWGDNDSRLLGPGKMYVAVFPDTEPHAHYRFKGFRPWGKQPDRTRAIESGTKVHSQPKVGSSVVDTLKEGELWEGWQYAYGDEFRNSKLWLGNHEGTRWVHAKRLDYVGGKT